MDSQRERDSQGLLLTKGGPEQVNCGSHSPLEPRDDWATSGHSSTFFLKRIGSPTGHVEFLTYNLEITWMIYHQDHGAKALHV